MNNCFTGYGIIDNTNHIVWSQCNQSENLDKNSLSLTKLVRDRDYPGFKIVYWSQSKLGGPTVTKEIQ